MISILVTLLIIVVVVVVAFWILSLLPIPQPWLNVIKVIIGLIVLIWLVESFLPMTSLHPLIR